MARLSPAAALAERLCRPQRIGIFGHRGVGKTTLLTMLYREAVGGRLPELRLAAGDAATANYLADKILQLESGSLLPATLSETPLRFQLYHRGTRLELIVKDYQGEHVAVGREEPIRDFLRECDAVWLCFDPAMMDSTASRLQGEQEAEQMIEDYLGLESDGPRRPMALILTKADLLPPHHLDLSEEAWIENVSHDRFGMTLHALRQHAPQNAVFSVSSLGPRQATDALVLADEKEPAAGLPAGPQALQPRNLAQPLRWLVEALQLQDEARMERLFELAPRNIRLLERSLRAFAQRYADSPRLTEFEARLSRLRVRRNVRRGLLATTAAVLLATGLWLVDTIRYRQAEAFQRSNEDLVAARERWQDYLGLPLSIGSRGDTARQHVRDLDDQIHEQKRQRDLTGLRALASDPAAPSAAVLERLKVFRQEFADTAGLDRIRIEIEDQVRPLRAREAREALDELVRREHLEGARTGTDAARKHLEDLVARADRALEQFGDTPSAEELRKKRSAYVHRIDEHDFEAARTYSRREPLSFATRRERYQQYLSRHPQGSFVEKSREAIREIETAWDRHDFRQVRDLYVRKPTEFSRLSQLCENYLAVHENGRFRKPAQELIAWIGRVNQPREYTVKAVKGDFSVKLGRWFTRGPDLSLEIEVNGVKHGPTSIVKNNYDPEWNYEFPRPIRWQPGDAVRIRVIDNDFSTFRLGRTIIDHSSSEDDKLAMKLLSGKFEFEEHAIYFESDFNMPTLPGVD